MVKVAPYVWRLVLNFVGLAAAVAAGIQRFGFLVAPVVAIFGWLMLVRLRVLTIGVPKVDVVATARVSGLLGVGAEARRVTITVREWLLHSHSDLVAGDVRSITLAAPLVNRLSDSELTTLIKYLSAERREYPVGWRAANHRWWLVVIIGPAAVTGAVLTISVPLAVAAGAASLEAVLYAWLIWRARASFADTSWLVSRFGDASAVVDVMNAGLSSAEEAESRIKSTLLWRWALLPYRYHPSAGRVAAAVARIQSGTAG